MSDDEQTRDEIEYIFNEELVQEPVQEAVQEEEEHKAKPLKAKPKAKAKAKPKTKITKASRMSGGLPRDLRWKGQSPLPTN